MESTLALLVAGFTPLVSLHLVTSWHSLVSNDSVSGRICAHDYNVQVMTVQLVSSIQEVLRSTTLGYLHYLMLSLIWTAEDTLVAAAGHDCQPVVFSGSEGGWQAAGSLDDTTAPKSSGGASKFGGASGVGRLNSAAFNTFRNADSRGQSSPISGPATDTELMTVHQNTITNIRPYATQGGKVTKVSTSGVDGKLVIWNMSNVSGLVPRLSGLHLK